MEQKKSFLAMVTNWIPMITILIMGVKAYSNINTRMAVNENEIRNTKTDIKSASESQSIRDSEIKADMHRMEGKLDNFYTIIYFNDHKKAKP